MIVPVWAALLLVSSPDMAVEAALCRVSGGVPTGSAQSTRALVRQAEVVVLARALEQRRPPDLTGFPPVQVKFQVLELLRGSNFPPEFWIRGALTDKDDFNTGAVPYLQVRSDGLRGSCYAYFYREGGDFLLLLHRDEEGVLSPYWGIFAPTNEQVRGPSDPWVAWTRSQLKTRRAPGT